MKIFNDDVSNYNRIKDVAKADILSVIKTVKECSTGSIVYLAPALPTQLPVDSVCQAAT
jgi:hypothetical protein